MSAHLVCCHCDLGGNSLKIRNLPQCLDRDVFQRAPDSELRTHHNVPSIMLAIYVKLGS